MSQWGRFGANAKQVPQNYGKDYASCDYTVPESEIPTFDEIDFPFTNTFNSELSLPLMASAIIDVDNDGLDEVFVGGGVDQDDAIFKYISEGFKNVSDSWILPDKAPGKDDIWGIVVRFG